MRRGTIAMVGLLLATSAMPQGAEARPLLFKMMGALTAPLGAVLGAARHGSRRAAYHRRAAVSHAAPAAAVAAAPAAAAAGAAAANSATPAATPNAEAASQETAGAASAQDSAPSAMPAPTQRNAALSLPDTESQTGSTEVARAPDLAQSRLGTVGPLAWPSAYEDVIGFTLWPKEYGERLRIHGIGDVLSTAFAPAAAIAAKTQQARAEQPNQTQVVPGTAVCGGADLTGSDWPIAQIKSMVELNDAQSAALDQLRTTLSDAVGSIKATCRDDTKMTPVERLRAMQNALWAVHDAAQLIRTPLSRFYDSLSDDQKRRFAAPASPQPNARLSRNDMARMCDLPGSTDALRRIEQSIRPTKPQRTSFEALQKKAFEMGQFLMASCLKPVPATPAERLDIAADRLTAVIFAASNVNMALNDFTSQLSDEQKAKLDALAR